MGFFVSFYVILNSFQDLIKKYLIFDTLRKIVIEGCCLLYTSIVFVPSHRVGTESVLG